MKHRSVESKMCFLYPMVVGEEINFPVVFPFWLILNINENIITITNILCSVS